MKYRNLLSILEGKSGLALVEIEDHIFFHIGACFDVSVYNNKSKEFIPEKFVLKCIDEEFPDALSYKQLIEEIKDYGDEILDCEVKVSYVTNLGDMVFVKVKDLVETLLCNEEVFAFTV